jgi:7-cyano-7-deazaguanine synthase in queuosine biosynthesis
MKDIYILKPTDTVYKITDHFSQPKSGKVGVAVSGGLESTLIAKIALEVYGSNNVVLLYSDNMFTKNSPESNKNVLVNVTNAEKLLDSPIFYCPIDTDLHTTDKISSVMKTNAMLKEKYNIEFTMWGFTKLFFDVAEFKQNAESTIEDIKAECYRNPKNYKAVIEEFHLPTNLYTKYIKDLDIPGDVYIMLRSDQAGTTLKRPFKDLNKSEVIDLYRQLGLLELAQQTHSCVTNSIRNDHTHCGICFNCQQRFDAFAKLGIEDKTIYAHSTVKEAWEELQKKLLEQH